MHIIYDGGNVTNQRLVVNINDNFVRGLSPDAILAESVSGDRGRVYDADGNDIAEPTTDAEGDPNPNYVIKTIRGYIRLDNSATLVRIVDSSFNLNRNILHWKITPIQSSLPE